jgi:hypothetical protein
MLSARHLSQLIVYGRAETFHTMIRGCTSQKNPLVILGGIAAGKSAWI